MKGQLQHLHSQFAVKDDAEVTCVLKQLVGPVITT